MKLFILSYNFFVKILTKKTFIFLIVAVLFCVGMPLLSSSYLASTPANKALWHETFSLQYMQQVIKLIYLFYPVVIGVCFSILYGESLSQGQCVYLFGGVNRLDIQISKWITMIAYYMVSYVFAFLVYQFVILTFDFGTFNFKDMSFFLKVSLNSVIISLLSILIINCTDNNLLGMIPPFLYFFINLSNSQSGFDHSHSIIIKCLSVFMPVQILISDSVNNDLSSEFGGLYTLIFIAIICVLSIISYSNKDL